MNNAEKWMWSRRKNNGNHSIRTANLKKRGGNLRDLWDNIKWAILHIIGI